MEDWHSRYPQGDTDLLARLQSNDDTNFASAFFELYLHELVLRLGYRPSLLPRTEKQPDFLIRGEDGDEFYLEAVLAIGQSPSDIAAEKRRNQVYDVINTLESPDFFIDLHPMGEPATEPPARKWRNDISRWLSSLDPDEVTERYRIGGFATLPEIILEYGGWTVRVRAFPKKADARGKPGVRPIGSWSLGPFADNSWQVIRDTVKRKAKRYGQLDKPYVIAVNALSGYPDQEDIEQALFGSESLFLEDSDDARPQIVPNRDGAWTGLTKPQYTRVSGVLITTRLGAWNIASRDLRLYHNPWATKPFTGPLTQLSEAISVDGFLKYKEGIHPRQLLGLPEAWPEQEDGD